MTWPAVSLLSKTYGEPRDPLGTLWWLWWMRFSLSHRLPFSPMSFTAVPFGARINTYRTDPLYALLMRAATLVADETVAYNLVLLLAFLSAGVACYYLVRRLTDSRPAAAVAGLAFAFSPYMLAQGKEHLGLVLTALIPLFMLLLVKAWKRPTWPSVAGCGAAFIALALLNYQYGFITAVYSAVFILTLYLSGRPWSSRKTGRDLRWKAAAVGAVILVAAALMMFSLLRSPLGGGKAEWNAYAYSARPWDYFIPPAEGALLGSLTRGFITAHLHQGFLVENTLFLGYVPLALAVFALLSAVRARSAGQAAGDAAERSRPEAPAPEHGRRAPERFSNSETRRLMLSFAVAGAAALVMSMPPSFSVGQQKIYLPSHLTFKLLPQFRAYARFGVIVMLSVAVLSGYGLALLLKRHFARRGANSPAGAWLTAALVSLLLLLEFSLVPPFHSLDARATTDYFRWLEGRPGRPVAAVYPMYQKDDFWDYGYLSQQRLHEKRLVNGADTGTAADVYRQSIIDIYHPATPGLLKRLGTRYVVIVPSSFEQSLVHVDYPFPTRFRESDLPPGLTPAARFPDGLIYEVTSAPAVFVPTFRAGFYEPYVDPGGRCWHPAEKDSTVRIDSDLAGTRRCNIIFEAMSERGVSTVRFELNGAEVLALTLPPWPTRVVIKEAAVRHGENRLAVRSSGKQVPLAEVPGYSGVSAAVKMSNVLMEEVR